MDRENQLVVTDRWKKTAEGMKKFSKDLKQYRPNIYIFIEDKKFLKFLETYGVYPVYKNTMYDDICSSVTLGCYFKDLFSDKSRVEILSDSEVLSLFYLYEKQNK